MLLFFRRQNSDAFFGHRPANVTVPQINVKHRVVIVSFLRFGIRNIIVCPQVSFLCGNARTFTDSIFAAWLRIGEASYFLHIM